MKCARQPTPRLRGYPAALPEGAAADTSRSEFRWQSPRRRRRRLSVVEGDTDFIDPQVPQTLDNVELTTDFPRVTLTTVVAPEPGLVRGRLRERSMRPAGHPPRLKRSAGQRRPD